MKGLNLKSSASFIYELTNVSINIQTHISPKLTGIAVHVLIFLFISRTAKNMPISPQIVFKIRTQSG